MKDCVFMSLAHAILQKLLSKKSVTDAEKNKVRRICEFIPQLKDHANELARKADLNKDNW